MQRSSGTADYRGLLLSIFVLGLAAVLFVAPNLFRSEAGSNGKGLIQRTESHDPNLEDFDIRIDKGSYETLSRFRQEAGRDASSLADVRDNFVRGENELRTRIPTLKIDYSTDLRVPQVITPDVWKSEVARMTAPSSEKRSEILRNFIKQNSSLVGVDNAQADALKVTADYTNPNGYMSFAHLEQRINGVQVYRAEIKAGFTKSGEMIRVLNDLVPGLNYETVSNDFRNPQDAVVKAFGYINAEPTKLDFARNDSASSETKVVFGNGDWATTAEKLYFPTEIGVVRPSWRVLIWQPTNAFYVIVDAETGTMLSRENITMDQAQSATYNVYTNSNAYINTADNPAPLSPGPINPTLGTQGSVITRNNVTRIGNEAPNPGQNNLGWITDGTNITDGNNVEAGIDRDGTNGVDATQTGSPNRVFSAPTWNPPPGNPAPGDEPLATQAQRGAVIQMFYVMNIYHDALYSLGFTEQARNFQNDNFGRGGLANDRISAEGQDSSGTNNANFSNVVDGTRGRMQMYLWTGPTPDYDGTTDAEVIVHEVTHGTSTRLHNNAMGNQGAMMGEGWSDWYGHTMLSEPTDPINGTYATGGYATYLIAAGFTGNYYYGIRRFPKAVIAFTGGPNNRPHNPLTFKHLNAGCDAEIGTTTTAVISAYPRGPIGTTGQCSQVHNAGEIWSSALWEVRSLMVTRLGWAAGTRRVLQVVTDGMKLAPQNPMMLQERDAIIAAASALPAVPEASADVADVREGFRRRGMGFSASTQSASAVTEAFDFPNVQIASTFSVSDATGDNDGFPEPGETVTLTVNITNTTGSTVNNVVVSVTGGGSATIPSINDGQTIPVQLSYPVPANAVCGSFHTVTINVSSSVGAQTPRTFSFRLGAPVGGAPASFTNSTPIDMPAGQPTTTVGPFAPYPSTINVTGLSGQKIIKVRFNGFHHEFESDLDMVLVGPGGQKYIFLSDIGGTTEQLTPITFSVSDSGDTILPPSTAIIDGTTYKPSNVTAGDTFAGGPAAPYENAAPVGTATFASVFGTDGATMNGTWSLYGVDDVGQDPGRIDGGWTLTFESDSYACQVGPVAATKSRADFDGDGKTDLSVFRPSNGGWYLQRSTAGFTGLTWGANGDVIVPSDYDGDNKTDTAVFRASNSAGVADFYILNSNGYTLTGYEWGSVGDIPVVGDYDGDNKADIAVFRPSESRWYIRNSGNGSVTVQLFGSSGDVPMSMDYDGDGKANLAVYRASNLTWYIARSTGVPGQNFDSVPFGMASDLLVPADYDGDNKDDMAVFRPSEGSWYIRKTSDSTVYTVRFGLSGDVPVPGDYDGDGKDDQAVYRNGTWYANRSTSGFFAAPFGLASDKPAPKAYIP